MIPIFVVYSFHFINNKQQNSIKSSSRSVVHRRGPKQSRRQLEKLLSGDGVDLTFFPFISTRLKCFSSTFVIIDRKNVKNILMN